MDEFRIQVLLKDAVFQSSQHNTYNGIGMKIFQILYEFLRSSDHCVCVELQFY